MSETRKIFQKFQRLLKEASEFGYASSLLRWDQLTKMPPGEAEGRAEIFAATKAEWFKLFTSTKVGKLLKKLASKEEELGSGEQLLLRRMLIIYERSKAIPPDLFEKVNKVKSRAYSVWVEAKAKSDFELFRPALQEIIGFVRQFVELYGYDKNPYDALLPDYEPGMTTDDLKRIIKPLREKLVPYVSLLTEQPDQPDETILQGHFSEERQEELSLEALSVIGYDFTHGRLDVTEHPFTTSIGPDDTRVTTHFVLGKLAPALFATLHEGGHALYDQGKAPLLKWVYLNSGYSHGLHESQSRMLENMVGRSLPFWRFFYPILQRIFPYYEGIPLEEFHRAINTVKPSPIRIYADEVTYNLHIMFRFEIEEALLREEIDVKDLPEIWNEKMQNYLGILPENDAKGVLQDVHWSSGYFGYFPTYMLGNLYAAQLFKAMKREITDLEEEIAKGNLVPLLEWLRSKIHRLGLVQEGPGLLRDVTGEAASSQPWLEYVEDKFSQIYRMG
jgi:carboxypeptidase Taq